MNFGVDLATGPDMEAATWLCACGRRGSASYSARADSRLDKRRTLGVNAAIWQLRAHQEIDGCSGTNGKRKAR